MGDIGKAVATRLAKDGMRIFLLYHKSTKNNVDTFIKSLSGSGHLALPCDLTSEKEVRYIVSKGEKKMGSLNICIHCAVGPIVRKKASDISLKDFREQFEVTTFGGLNLFQAVIPIMKKQKQGRIIALTSSAIRQDAGVSGMSGYASAKQALQAILRDLSLELSPHNIMVNAVAPSFVLTRLHKDLPEQVQTFISERTPSNTKEEVAKTISFLCSEKTNNITGKSYPVGEGQITKL